MGLISDSWTFDFSVLFISIFALIFWLVNRRYTYWERKGFKTYPNPKFLVGHFGPTFAQKDFIGELIARIYKNVNEPFVGIYGFLWPFLLVCDPRAIRNILIKDFQYFTDRMYKIFSILFCNFHINVCFCALMMRWSLFRRRK